MLQNILFCMDLKIYFLSKKGGACWDTFCYKQYKIIEMTREATHICISEHHVSLDARFTRNNIIFFASNTEN